MLDLPGMLLHVLYTSVSVIQPRLYILYVKVIVALT